MSNDVFANGREVSCKKADGKSICAFPDVCFTPPENPATPPGVPIPYPNTGMAKDMTSGSKKVKVSGKEVMLKNKSYFKKSMGDEAGSAAKKGVVTSVNRGKVYFISWSMDVKFEGKNVVRHLDMTTHNHASPATNTPPWAYLDSQAMAKIKDCEQNNEDASKACKDSAQTFDSKGKLSGRNCTNKCKKAQKCILISKENDKKGCCKDETTGHHLIEGHCFVSTTDQAPLEGLEAYDYKKAPCVCASSSRYDGSHGLLHAVQSTVEAAFSQQPIICEWLDAGKKIKERVKRDTAKSRWRYEDARKAGVEAHKATFPDSNCNEECIKQQLDVFHINECGFDKKTELRTDPVKRKGKKLTKKIEISRFNKAVKTVLSRVSSTPS